MATVPILLLCSDYPPRVSGGVATHVHDLARGLVRRGWTPTVVTGGRGAEPEIAVEDGVKVVRVRLFDGARGGEPCLRSRSVAEICCRIARASRCRILHLHDSFLAPVAELVRSGTGLPLLVTQHSCMQAIIARTGAGTAGPLSPSLDRVRQRERHALRLASAVVCVSDVVADELRAVGGLLPPLHVVQNGVDLEFFGSPEPGEVARARARMAADGERLVLFAGRGNGVKGWPELIFAAGLVREQAPDAHFAFLLCGGDAASVSALRGLGLGGGAIRFLDSVPRADMPAHLAAADLVAVPSRWEPFGLVAVEAMAAARPVVVSDVPPLNRIVVDRVTGRVVPRREGPRGVVDVGALARAILELLRLPPEALAAMGRRGRHRAGRLYSVDRTVEGTIRVYTDLVNSSARATDTRQTYGEREAMQLAL
jgi:glycosyltransferase involved in cell wall biosynthesis